MPVAAARAVERLRACRRTPFGCAAPARRAGSAALANAAVCAEDATVAYGECASTNAAGEYVISGLPTGGYTLSFFDEEEGSNYLPISEEGVSVTAGSTTSGINGALSPGGQITGRVTAAAGGAALANIRVFFQFVEPGTLRWSLFFKNADIGFAASLGQLADDVQPAPTAPAGAGVALAEAAKKKSRRCKKGIKHKGKCVRALVPFGSGSKSVTAGAVEIKVHPAARARKALDAGRTLHVSGQFTFQSTLGGPPVTHSVSATARGHKKKRHSKKKR